MLLFGSSGCVQKGMADDDLSLALNFNSRSRIHGQVKHKRCPGVQENHEERYGCKAYTAPVPRTFAGSLPQQLLLPLSPALCPLAGRTQQQPDRGYEIG